MHSASTVIPSPQWAHGGDFVTDDQAARAVEFVGTVVWFQPSAEME